MFTGIVEQLGEVLRLEWHGEGGVLEVRCPPIAADVREGDSVAVNGACLTVVRTDGEAFAADVMKETFDRTSLGTLTPGAPVNLERAATLATRLGGHLVQGHVDGVGTVQAIRRDGEHVLLDVALPAEVADVTVLHGSIAINGVSLTVNALPGPDVAQVALIPYTWDHTNLRHLREGDRVNLEGDMIGKFVAHLVERRRATKPGEISE